MILYTFVGNTSFLRRLNDVSYLKELKEVLQVTLDDILTFDNT